MASWPRRWESYSHVTFLLRLLTAEKADDYVVLLPSAPGINLEESIMQM